MTTTNHANPRTDPHPDTHERRITVIGWDGSLFSPAASQAIAGATLLIGGARHLQAAGPVDGATRITLGPLGPALDAIDGHDGHNGRIVVLASGDPGFFGIVRALRARGFDPVVLPAVSSIAAAFGLVGESWDDALVASAHGRGERDLRRAANLCRAHGKVAVLTAPGVGPGELARELLVDPRCVPDRVLAVAERLGSPDVRLRRLTLAEAAERGGWQDPNVVLCLDPGRGTPPKGWLAGRPEPASAASGWALPESGFAHRDSMITKAEVRALALPRLAPGPGDLVWDLGAGSGSVGIECARFGAAVVAVEQDPESCQRICANAAAHGVEVCVVAGRMPEVLAGLPRPDAVFVGGGGSAAVRAALKSGPRRIVAALAAIERAGEVASLLAADDRKVDGVLTQSSRLAVLPDGTHRFAAQNPVFVIWGDAV
jgi:precorrin-6B C5,15-methyltransferase / cobalt-precorrin-6B C5,C15-methyltransferase